MYCEFSCRELLQVKAITVLWFGLNILWPEALNGKYSNSLLILLNRFLHPGCIFFFPTPYESMFFEVI